MKIETAETLEHMPPPKMLIDTLIPLDSITMIAGPKYSGKTFVALELALAVAYKKKFMGKWTCPNPGNVLFFEQDSPKYDTGRALWSMIKPFHSSLKSDPEQHSYPIRALNLAWHQGLDLSDKKDILRIIKSAESLHTPLGTIPNGYSGAVHELSYDGPRLLIFDTFNAVQRGDENSATEMGVVTQNIKDLRDTLKCAILVIHHTAYPKEGFSHLKPRGSSALEAAMDNIFLISQSRKTGLCSVKVDRARAIAPEDFHFRIETTDSPKTGTVKTVEFFDQAPSTPKVESQYEEFKAMLLSPRAGAQGILQRDALDWASIRNIGRNKAQRWIHQLETALIIKRDRTIHQGKSLMTIFPVDP